MKPTLGKKELWSKPRKKKGEILWAVLDILINTPGAVAQAFVDPHQCQTEFEGIDIQNLGKYLSFLKRSRYIETKHTGSQISVRLTDRGRIKYMENPANLGTDHKLRAVSYDIPQFLRAKRQKFCRFLKRIGFRQLQKSLWVSHYSKADQIEAFLREYQLEKYVAYFIIEKSNIDKFIEDLFSK